MHVTKGYHIYGFDRAWGESELSCVLGDLTERFNFCPECGEDLRPIWQEWDEGQKAKIQEKQNRRRKH